MYFSSWPSLIGIAIASYLIGSIASAVIVARIFKLPDPRLAGSGNPGATNVLRLGGKKAAIITLLGDLGKGLLPVLLLRALAAPDEALAVAALLAFIGHLFPVFFGFKGGKGVATAAGALLGLNPIIGLLTIGTWLLTARITRFSSAAAIVAAVAAALASVYLTSPPIMLAINLMSITLIYRHRQNIRRLLRGEEPRIGQKTPPTP
ncbi:glycerol-3-phosphate 1-O-acyltransferase PlsY [Halothiobacillus sp.]|uniref:glycerol-3-phosphate 1-O-acyltransferase PlsY n=1 Tax=Halothiobacillus sp. TaxID=1891311 RepID=UPI002AD52583|nr:glycerol-3-phosphate 1-O-acyltransferase PlsY [Halothiobacillus sp.]